MSKDLLLNEEGLPVVCAVCRDEFEKSTRYTIVSDEGNVLHYHDHCMSATVRKRIESNTVRPKGWTDGPMVI